MEDAPLGTGPDESSPDPAVDSAAPGSSGAGSPDPGPRRLSRGALAVGAVLALAGMLFATNASVFRDPQAGRPEDLTGLLDVENARLDEASAEVDDLRSQVESLVDTTAGDAEVEGAPEEVAVAAGGVAVSGPGVVVELWDAPTANAPAGTRPDDLLVHQQDLEAVINAMWAGGAEAMTIQGNRVTTTTRVRCVGNVLLLHGRTYSPPYEVAAIGDPGRLQRTLLASTGVRIYLQYVDAVGLGWSLTERAELEMPAADVAGTLQHAEVVAGGGASTAASGV